MWTFDMSARAREYRGESVTTNAFPAGGPASGRRPGVPGVLLSKGMCPLAITSSRIVADIGF
jgi:hypothetical protein